MVSDKDIQLIVTGADNVREACTRLIERANEGGGHDNITAVLIKIEDAGARRTGASTPPAKSITETQPSNGTAAEGDERPGGPGVRTQLDLDGGGQLSLRAHLHGQSDLHARRSVLRQHHGDARVRRDCLAHGRRERLHSTAERAHYAVRRRDDGSRCEASGAGRPVRPHPPGIQTF